MSVLTAAPVRSLPARSLPARSLPARSLGAVSAGTAAAPRAAVVAVATAVPSEGTHVRLTRRGRAVVLTLVVPLALVAILALAAAIAGSFAVPAKAGDSMAPSAPVATYVVEPGDSLWSIALQVAPNEDPRSTVSALVAMNGIQDPATLRVGAELVVPLTP